jgi:hypothetical protein
MLILVIVVFVGEDNNDTALEMMLRSYKISKTSGGTMVSTSISWRIG